MGLVLLVGIAAMGCALLAGGSGPLRAPRLAGAGLLAGALAVQLAEPLVATQVAYSYPLSLAVSATLLVQFAARNVHVPGVALAAAGLVANAAVVLINGAMPVSERAAERAGIAIEALALESDSRHEPTDGATRLPALADRIPVPIPGHREVDSVGDLALAAGVGLFAFHAAHRGRGGTGGRYRVPDSGTMTGWAPGRC